MPTDVRPQIVHLATQAVMTEQAKLDFNDLEVRPLALKSLEGSGWWGDCSWFCKTVYWQAGVSNDPTGCGYDGYGNSVDFYYRGQHVTQAELLPGDIITFGPDGDVHAVICVTNTPDPVCASMGRQGDPSLVPLSVLSGLGTPTFLRFSTIDQAAPAVPARAVTPTDLKKNQLVHLPNPADAKLALANGWTLFIWDGYKFVAPHPRQTKGTDEYANVHYRFKRP